MTRVLPSNSTLVEEALDGAADCLSRFGSELEIVRGVKLRAAYTSSPAGLLPFIAGEFGFGEITDDLFDPMSVFGDAIAWQRIRGTPAAVGKALSWVGYAGGVENSPPSRRRWNRFQVSLDRVRDDEVPDLARIDRFTRVSVPARSRFSRGFCGYDVRAAATSISLTSGTLVGDNSGARISGISAKWSFGRPYDRDATLSQAELQALGAWIPPGSGPIVWADTELPWSDMDIQWDSAANAIRVPLMAAVLAKRGAWAVFKRVDGSVIGCRRCRASHRVSAETSGPYSVAGSGYRAGLGEYLYLEAMTDFGDGDGETATSVGFLIGAEPKDGAGTMWRQIADLRAVVGGSVVEDAATVQLVGQQAVSIKFGKTVRERARALLRMT